MATKVKMVEMSALVAGKAEEERNVANGDALMDWLGKLAESKLGGLRDAGSEEEKARAMKAAVWLASVGRRHFLKNGLVDSRVGKWTEGESVSGLPEWAKTARKSGRRVDFLKCEASEASQVVGVLDWLRAADGPGLDADWSRMNFGQARVAEEAWIEAMAKEAKKLDWDALDAAGTSLYCGAGEGFDGWRWVRVESPEALDREGALMRHCVGSYASEVASGSSRIYSLRDPENKPRLTVEESGGCLAQLKAFANGACPEDLRPAVAVFMDRVVAAWGNSEPEDVAEMMSEDFKKAGFAWVRSVGVVDTVSGPSLEKRRAIDVLFEKMLGNDRGELEKLLASGDEEEIEDWFDRSKSDFLVSDRRMLAAMEAVAARASAKWMKSFAKAASLYVEAERRGHWTAAWSPDVWTDALLVAIRGAGARGDAEALDCALAVDSSKDALRSALLGAVQGGQAEMVDKLEGSMGLDADAWSAGLGEAAQSGRLDMFRRLGEKVPPGKDWLLLGSAIEGGNILVVEAALERGTTKEQRSVALVKASARDAPDMMEKLLAEGCSKKSRGEALEAAAGAGRLGSVKCLLQADGKLSQEAKEAALSAALAKDRVDCAEVLLASCASQKIAGEMLADACACGGGSKMVALLARQAKPSLVGSELCVVAGSGNADLAKALLPFVADEKVRDKALSEAWSRARWEAVEAVAPSASAKALAEGLDRLGRMDAPRVRSLFNAGWDASKAKCLSLLSAELSTRPQMEAATIDAPDARAKKAKKPGR